MRLCLICAIQVTVISFNLRREAAPHATTNAALSQRCEICFNLRREAAPHATRVSVQSRIIVSSVSISDEKPLHMRLLPEWRADWGEICFNLRREAAPHATGSRRTVYMYYIMFQSQTRSRSTCDPIRPCL